MADGRLVGAGLGLLAVGAAVGSVLERRLVRAPLRDAHESGAGFGSLHSDPRAVLAADGVELYVEVDEAPEAAAYPGLTVVFSHGYALNLDCWHFQRQALRGRVRAVYWDQRGHGRSGMGDPAHDTIEQLGLDLAAVLDAVAPTGPVVLVGHSMGGMTVMSYADGHREAFGDRVVGVALLATSAGQLARVNFGVPTLAARQLRRLAPGLLHALGSRPDLVQRGRRSGSDVEHLLTRLYSFRSDVPAATVEFVARMNAATPLHVIADFFPAFDDHDKFAALDALQRVEVLVMVGEGDILTPAEHSREIVRVLPNADLLVLPDTGHMLQLERPQKVNEGLLDLLDRSAALVGVPGPTSA